MTPIEKEIEGIVDGILEDYRHGRDIDKLDPFQHPDKAVVIDMIGKLLRIVYPTCEQIGETVKSSQGGLFKQVALFEYPKKGSYAIGFITNFNEEKFEVNEDLQEEVYSIFMPTTPNPTSGFLIFVPKRECKILKMSVSEAMTLIVSGGVILPGKKLQAGK